MGETFNPVKETSGGKRVARVIWTTAKLEQAKNAIAKGKPLSANPFYEKDVRLLRENLVYKRTDAEIAEFSECACDIIKFASYCSLKTPLGVRRIQLRDYQADYLRHLVANKLSIFLAARQSGKTTTTALFVLWFVLFNTDKNVMITGNKLETAHEILDKIKNIFYELPYNLKPGVIKWNEGSVVFDNGCRILTTATTKKASIGYTLDLVVADEFAHLPDNISESFYENIFPTISAGGYRFAIMSTQNGHNLFYRLWTAAKDGASDYAPFEVTWDMVPTWDPVKKAFVPRTEEWKQKQIANLGSIEAFNAQFGTQFDLSSGTLIAPKKLKELARKSVKWDECDLQGLAYSEYWKWDGEDDDAKHIITIDLAEGIGNDYTVISDWRAVREGAFEMHACWRCNCLPIEAVPKVLLSWLAKKKYGEQVIISYEQNTYGDLFMEYCGENEFDRSMFVSRRDSSSKRKYGFKMTGASKAAACSSLKRLVEAGSVSARWQVAQSELENFCMRANGTFSAANGHDDIVMTMVQLAGILPLPCVKSFLSRTDLRKYTSGKKEFVDIYGIMGGHADYSNANSIYNF